MYNFNRAEKIDLTYVASSQFELYGPSRNSWAGHEASVGRKDQEVGYLFGVYTGRAILLHKSMVVDISSVGVFATTARVLLAETVTKDL